MLRPRKSGITAESAAALGLPDCTIGHTYAFEAVPTDVEAKSTGALIVSLLPGGEEPSLGARGAVIRLAGDGEFANLADGFFGAVNVALRPGGKIYVTELFGNKLSLLKNHTVTPVRDLESPSGSEFRTRLALRHHRRARRRQPREVQALTGQLRCGFCWPDPGIGLLGFRHDASRPAAAAHRRRGPGLGPRPRRRPGWPARGSWWRGCARTRPPTRGRAAPVGRGDAALSNVGGDRRALLQRPPRRRRADGVRGGRDRGRQARHRAAPGPRPLRRVRRARPGRARPDRGPAAGEDARGIPARGRRPGRRDPRAAGRDQRADHRARPGVQPQHP